MTLRAFGMPCSLPPDGVVTPPAGKPPGPGPSGGHEKRPGLAATRLTFVFQQRRFSNASIDSVDERNESLALSPSPGDNSVIAKGKT